MNKNNSKPIKKNKSKYWTHVYPRLNEIRTMRMDGHSEENISKIIGVHRDTLRKYKNEYKELEAVLLESKEVLISKLELTLYQRALGGHKVVDVKKRITQDSSGKDVTLIEETTRELEPNITALIFSLKNLTKGTGKWLDVRMIDMIHTRMEDNENLNKIAEALDSLGDKYLESKEQED